MDVTTGLTEVTTACAKHANVKADVTTGLTEVTTACAKHANVKADVTTGLTEVATAYKKDFFTGLTYISHLKNGA